jgi:phosphatidylserine/phosphatidylglycerophosphate/cardiolipin synthase-like enzyme
MRRLWASIGMAAALVVTTAEARADQLCDPSFEDCRAPLINLIRAERVGIDVAFWFMEDARYSGELARKAQEGVPVRVLVDTRANAQHPINDQVIAQMAAAGIPIRTKTGGPILHWKLMLFAGQQQVEFSGANYSPGAFTPIIPYVNYTDEAIYFSSDPAIVQSFMRKFDDSWIDPSLFTNYANVPATRARRYAQFAITPQLNFPPGENYRTRAVARYNAEPSAIDVLMFRITDTAHTDAMIAAAQRGVRVRLITELDEYRLPSRMWHSWNLDRLYMAGIPVRVRAHAGLNHEKAVILRGQGMTIFGSSNWTSPSADGQEEHNLFTTSPAMLQWFSSQFDRKWNNRTGNVETEPFVPLPPDVPVYSAPASQATGTSGAVLQFSAGPFAHLYDIYLGTSPDPSRIASDVPLGPSVNGALLSYSLPPLRPKTTYFWRVVAKTMAQQGSAGPVWSFTTSAQGAFTGPAGDVDADGRADLTVWRPSTGTFFWLTSLSGYSPGLSGVKQWGNQAAGDRPFLGDIDGDGAADLIVWRASTGTWFWLTSSSDYSYATSRNVQWGNQSAGDVPMLGDIDGDGRCDLMVWRASTGTWFWLTSSSGYTQSGSKQWGSAATGDVPLVADLDGDGKSDLVVWRPGSGTWFWLTSSSGYSTSAAGIRQWGNQADKDIPMLSDLDGDGRADLVVWRHGIGTWIWLTSSSGYKTSGSKQWGNGAMGDVPMSSDLDGDRKSDLIVWRPSTGTWYWLTSSSGYNTAVAGIRQWGASADIPVVR